MPWQRLPWIEEVPLSQHICFQKKGGQKSCIIYSEKEQKKDQNP